jgi:hypothetical protein
MLMVFSDGVNLLMKPIMPPSAVSFKKLIQDGNRYAKEAGLKKSDVEEAIRKVQSHARRPGYQHGCVRGDVAGWRLPLEPHSPHRSFFSSPSFRVKNPHIAKSRPRYHLCYP